MNRNILKKTNQNYFTIALKMNNSFALTRRPCVMVRQTAQVVRMKLILSVQWQYVHTEKWPVLIRVSSQETITDTSLR